MLYEVITYFRPGGVKADLPEELLQDIYDWADKEFPKILADIETLLNDNRIFKQRTVDIGVFDKEEAIDWGFSGPNLRASGVAWDLLVSLRIMYAIRSYYVVFGNLSAITPAVAENKKNGRINNPLAIVTIISGRKELLTIEE